MRFVFAGGGTGGHIFPMLAVAKKLQALQSDIDISFVGSTKAWEAELIGAAGYPFSALAAKGIVGKPLLTRLKNTLGLPLSVLRAYRMLRTPKADCVFGLGGYIAGPVVLAAKLQGIPTAILEPNAVAGMVNQVLGNLVRKIFIAFPAAKKQFPPSKVIISGNPLREEIVQAAGTQKAKEPLCVLIFGGSQGARRLNLALTEALPLLADLHDKLHFLHQTGSEDATWVEAAYKKQNISATVTPFIEQMGAAYGQAHLVVARSGSSVFEIAAAGLPSILIPYPFSARGHQQANAKYLAEKGAALVIDDAQADGPRLAKELGALLQNETRRQQMAQAASGLAMPQASLHVAETLLKLARREAC